MEYRINIELDVSAGSAEEALRKAIDVLATAHDVPVKLYSGGFFKDYIGSGRFGLTKGNLFYIKSFELD